MKIVRLFVAGFFLTTFFVVSNLTQTNPAKLPGESKVALINTFAFADAKTGITKYVNAVKTLESEFKPIQTELESIESKLQTLSKEIQTFRESAGKKVPVNQTAINAKVEEGEKLQRDFKFKQEDAAARAQRREQALIGPIMQDIYKAAQEFSKQKGFMLVLDIAKMDQAGILLAWDEKADITKEFITFYNARPPGNVTAP